MDRVSEKSLSKSLMDSGVVVRLDKHSVQPTIYASQKGYLIAIRLQQINKNEGVSIVALVRKNARDISSLELLFGEKFRGSSIFSEPNRGFHFAAIVEGE